MFPIIVNKSMKVSILALVLLILTAHADEVVVQRHAVIRAEPHGRAERLGTAEKDDRFPLLDKQPTNNWYRISYEDGAGWIYSRSVTVEETPETIRIASVNVLPPWLGQI